ncbi:F-box/LRR-repeat protein 14-like [Zootoca vivipara]|uniref:F-box/LRR-repeat protein 14-like n=1 Tax=Zootoca vivipara TaxID=8524 RepID=UPI0015912330|nr:F-box/LRR-repeat protein 14-like [Zootoca vivipara]
MGPGGRKRKAPLDGGSSSSSSSSEQGPPPPPISLLPPELLIKIFEYLDDEDQVQVSQVCRDWRAAAYQVLWWRAEAPVSLCQLRADPSLLASLAAWGIRRVRIVMTPCVTLGSVTHASCTPETYSELCRALRAGLPSLRALNMTGCPSLTKRSLAQIGKHLKGLEELVLFGCRQVSDAGLLLLANRLRHLKKLTLDHCCLVTNVGVGHLAGITASGCLQLECLSLENCDRLSDVAVHYVAQGLPRLRYLSVRFCGGIRDGALVPLSRLTRLRTLNLSFCQRITDVGVGHIAGITADGCLELEELDLAGCGQLSDLAVRYVAQGLPRLVHLSLRFCGGIGDGALLSMSLLSRLKSLNLSFCQRISDVGIGHLAGITSRGCLELEQLNLDECERLTNLTCRYLAQGLSCLRHLKLCCCEKIRDEALLFLSGMRSLRILEVSYCNITDEGIGHLARGGLPLSTLNITCCETLGDASLAYITQGLGGLRKLHCCGCNFSLNGILQLEQQMPALSIL